jgi:hypothetical protein
MNYLGLNAASWVKVAELGIVGVAFKGGVYCTPRRSRTGK